MPTMKDYLQNPNYWLFFSNLLNRFSYKIVISDNYIEPGFFSNKAYIFANFVWQLEVVPQNRQNILVEKIKKKISSNVIFMHGEYRYKYIDNFKSYNYGLIKDEKNKNIKKIKNKKFTVFVAKGFGNWSKFLDRKINKWLIDLQKQKKDVTFIVDKTINIPLSSKKNIRQLKKYEDLNIFDYDLVMGRPSIGILTLALSNQVPFIPFFDKDDRESINNGSIYKTNYPYFKNIRLFNKKNIRFIKYKVQNEPILEDGLEICVKKIRDGLINENFSNNSR
ncbi:hypothetical protein OBA40_09470 [Alphaproteobacteria bacterium]|nr:hypothetical protein [Alphaproteobacteria bacterium]